ncbi:MAG: MFS transporter [Bacteroidia bacterium]
MSQPNVSAPAKEKFTSGQVLMIALLALTQFTVVLDFMVMSPLGDVLKKTMHLTTQQFGFVVAGYALSAGASGLLTAGFADSFDRKKLLLFFYIGFIGGTLCCGLADTFPLLLAARIITGIFGGVIGAISMAIVTDVFPAQQRGRVMGFMQMGFGASQVLGIPIGLHLSNIYGWQSPFLMIVGLASLIWLTILFKMMPVTKHLEIKNENKAFRHLVNTLKSERYRIGFLTTALLSLGGYMMMPWGSVYSINNLGITKEQLVPLFMVGGVGTLIIMPIIGKISDKVDKFKVFAFASCWMIAVVCVYTNLPPIPLWTLMIFNVLMMGGIMGRMVPSMALMSSLPEMRDRGAFMSINSSLQQIAGGIAAAMGGLVVRQKTEFSPIEHYNYLGYIVSAISIFCIFMLYKVAQVVKQQAN